MSPSPRQTLSCAETLDVRFQRAPRPLLLAPRQQLDVQAFGEHLPDVNFECVVSVDDEDEICAGDVAAVRRQSVSVH